MQKGTRTTRCEHCKFARRDVWAHQQCLLRWNGINRHGCPPLHLETFVCQRFVTPDKESSMSTLWQEEEFNLICSRESRITSTIEDSDSLVSCSQILIENLVWFKHVPRNVNFHLINFRGQRINFSKTVIGLSRPGPDFRLHVVCQQENFGICLGKCYNAPSGLLGTIE